MAFGYNWGGQLGLGHKEDQKEPALVPWSGPRPVQVDWGYHHSLVLDEEGGVWAAGVHQGPSFVLSFERVAAIPLVTQVAAGYDHSAALDVDGALWMWTNRSSLLGWFPTPQRVEGFPLLQRVACGRQFIVAEAEEGGLWVLGDNCKGQLGLGHTFKASMPTLVKIKEPLDGSLRCLAALHSGILVVDAKGALWTAGCTVDAQVRQSGDGLEFQRIEGVPPLVRAACGHQHSLALDEVGRVWVWGGAEHGQLGTGSTINQLQPVLLGLSERSSGIACGGFHSLAFQHDGSLLIFGNNCFGQLGLSHTISQPLPTLSPLLCQTGRKKSARSDSQRG